MTRDDVLAKVYEIWAACNKTFYLKNKSTPSVSFFSKSSTAGKAWYSEHRVEFNEIWALENSKEFETTIAHELAHLVTNQLYPQAKQHHGPEFKHVMQTMGYDYRTYHSYNTDSVSSKRVKTRFEYACTVCGKTYEIAKPTHTKMQLLKTATGIVAGYSCKCKGPIYFTGVEKKFV